MVNRDYVRLEHLNRANEKFLVVNWCLGNTCNYSCSYCPTALHDASRPWFDLEVAQRFCQSVMSHYRDKRVYFEFTGGEVTLWKDLPQLTRFLKNAGASVGIISNGARSLEFWETFFPAIDHVCLSYHAGAANEDHFLTVVEAAAQKVRTHVNFMMDPEFFNKAYAFAVRVKQVANISVALQPLVKDFGSELFPYSDLQKQVLSRQHELIAKHIKFDKKFEYFRGAMAMVNSDGARRAKEPQTFISAGENDWKDWLCHAGLEQIVVDMEGNIFRGWCQVGGAIGKVSDETILFPVQPILCTKSSCHCNLDIMTTKEYRPAPPAMVGMDAL